MQVKYKWEKMYGDGMGINDCPTGELYDDRSDADTKGQPYGTSPEKVKVIVDGEDTYIINSEISLENAIIIDDVCYSVTKVK